MGRVTRYFSSWKDVARVGQSRYTQGDLETNAIPQKRKKLVILPQNHEWLHTTNFPYVPTCWICFRALSAIKWYGMLFFRKWYVKLRTKSIYSITQSILHSVTSEAHTTWHPRNLNNASFFKGNLNDALKRPMWCNETYHMKPSKTRFIDLWIFSFTIATFLRFRLENSIDNCHSFSKLEIVPRWPLIVLRTILQI